MLWHDVATYYARGVEFAFAISLEHPSDGQGGKVNVLRSCKRVTPAVCLPVRTAVRLSGRPPVFARGACLPVCLPSGSLVLAGDELGDRLQLDVAGALVDGADLAVAVELLGGEVLGEAHAAHPLDGLGGDALGDL